MSPVDPRAVLAQRTVSIQEQQQRQQEAEMIAADLDAYRYERAGYAAKGWTDRVRQVDEQIEIREARIRELLHLEDGEPADKPTSGLSRMRKKAAP
jgi:hypothetical protein